MTATAPIERVLKRLADLPDDECWIWPGSKTNNGYGTVSAAPPYVEKPRPLLVHRVTYEYFIGPIPEGMDSDHLCRNRPCCNPRHIELVTRLVNANRGEKSSRGLKKSCKYGHPWPEYRYRPPWRKHYFCIGCYTKGGKKRGEPDRGYEEPLLPDSSA